jgi:hypothetical protein
MVGVIDRVVDRGVLGIGVRISRAVEIDALAILNVDSVHGVTDGNLPSSA